MIPSPVSGNAGPDRQAPPRVFFFVQHLLGIGHLQRSAQISAAMAARGLEVLLVSGGMPVSGLNHGEAKLLQLPPIKSLDATFARLVDERDEPVGEALWASRRKQLMDTVRRFKPQVVIIESWPFGRRSLRGELGPLVEELHGWEPRPLVVCSIRDILQIKRKPSRYVETVDWVERCFDRILIHGDPSLVSLDASFPQVGSIRHKLHYTGYVRKEFSLQNTNETPGLNEVLVSTGGGAVGQRLYRVAFEARGYSSHKDLVWRFLVGAGIDQLAVKQLGGQRRSGVIVEPARVEFPDMLRRCAVSISMAGYNTVTDLLASGARSVLVPFTAEGETEQQQRADCLAAHGRVQVVHESDLNPRALAAAVDRALERPVPEMDIDLNGAARTAELVQRWAEANEHA